MTYDVVVIGGGPAGMVAALRSAERGARVLLLEKNDRLGIKLLATGHGRCNITNTLADNKKTIGVYGPNARFLFSAFSKFGVDATREYFSDLGIDTNEKDHGRIFPQSNKASDVQEALVKNLQKNDVKIKPGVAVSEIVASKKKIKKVILETGEEILGKSFVVATGGMSYPDTGSTGDGYLWLEKLGHTINIPRPALTSMVVKEGVSELEGLSLHDVVFNVYQKNEKILSRTGDMIFTADGVSGPAIIDLSSQVGTLLPDVALQIDLQPGLEKNELDKKMQNDFHSSNNKTIKNYLFNLVPSRLSSEILERADINNEKTVSTISKEERQGLIDILKNFSFTVESLQGFQKAMITAGGVDIKKVDPKTMNSKIYTNLFLAGEILDLDGPTGGYNLQICWSTGYVAGDSVEL